MQTNEEPISICAECWHTLPFWRKDDVPVPNLIQTSIESFSAPFLYEEPIKKLVQKFKYEDTPEFAHLFAKYMNAEVAHVLQKEAEDEVLVLPVPMHSTRLWKRQFNQSMLLSKKIAEYYNMAHSYTALKRVKKTQTQQGKTAKQRQQNLSGAFMVDAKQVENKSIILIDDVWTTGTTAQKCASALVKAGAKNVHVVTLCYVEKK